MRRSLYQPIKADLSRKIILISGARQVGKTTLSRDLEPDHDYLNFDNADDAARITEKSWDRKKKLLVLDELHKMRDWKRFLKGIYDVEGLHPPIVVTGSARIDTYRKVGDSLAGRYFRFRLHPLDLKELATAKELAKPDEALESILNISGFPEPFFEGSVRFYNRWAQTHLDIILRQDLLDLEHVRQIKGIELLLSLLRRRVGSPLSLKSLSEDLHVDDKTVKRWLSILEDLFVVFRVGPFHRNIARAISKSPKYYFYDTARVEGDHGVKLENAVACALLKEIHRRQDCDGESYDLHYLRDRNGKEVDFGISKKDKLVRLIEVKTSDDILNPALFHFQKFAPEAKPLQLVRVLKREKSFPGGAEIRRAADWLQTVDLER